MFTLVTHADGDWRGTRGKNLQRLTPPIGSAANVATRAAGGGTTTRITSSQRSDMTAADHLSSGRHSLPRPVSRHPARIRSSDATAIFKFLVIRKIRQQKQRCRWSDKP
jgi:hypothetical protein